MGHFKPTLPGRAPRHKHALLGVACITLPVVASCSSEGEVPPEWAVTSASTDTATTSVPTAYDTTTSEVSATSQVSVTTAPSSQATSSSAETGASTSEAMTSEPDPILEALPVIQSKILTQREYRNTVAALLQVDASELTLPEDTAIAGFGTVGAKVVTVNEVAAEAYEKASQTVVASIFEDEQRWQALVGCQPEEELTDSCVETYVSDFGRLAFRRPLTDEEVQQWVGLARAAAIAGDEPNAAMGLAAVTAGLLQSPNFLYRVEYAVPDVTLGRIKFDGESMATRLAYLITGTAPDEELLNSVAAGALDTADGVRQAATQLLASSGATEHITEFFAELTQLELARKVERDEELFPGVDDELRDSMVAEARRWLTDVVLAPGADYREFFVSQTTFVDQRLAEFYELRNTQGEDFRETQLGAETGRAGILGKAAFLMAHSSPDSSNPTRRGNYIVKSFTCIDVPPPTGIVVSLPEAEEGEGPKTTRQLFESHAIDATCIGCHSIMDPYGFALEHFDSAGRYREQENGLDIDTKATFQNETFDGAVELGEVLFRNERTTECFVKNFYRYANGTEDGTTDGELITSLAANLEQNGYVWRDLLVEFAASDAFTSLAASVGIPKVESETEEAVDAL